MASWPWGCLGMAAGPTWIGRCSGDDKTLDATTIGAEGQACLPGDQCIAGLPVRQCEVNGHPASSIAAGEGGVLREVGNPKATQRMTAKTSARGRRRSAPRRMQVMRFAPIKQRVLLSGPRLPVGQRRVQRTRRSLRLLRDRAVPGHGVEAGHCCLEVDAGPARRRVPSDRRSTTEGLIVCTGGADTPCDPDFDIELCQIRQPIARRTRPCAKTVLNVRQGVDGTPRRRRSATARAPAVSVRLAPAHAGRWWRHAGRGQRRQQVIVISPP